MEKNYSLEIKKESFWQKIINKIKLLFGSKENDNVVRIVSKKEREENNLKERFAQSLKVNVDLATLSLKVKLENNEIKAIDLTDEQIDKLQAIYDKEIQEKKDKLLRLKQSA